VTVPPALPEGFRYPRRVQFAETDLAGIVHFSTMFRYMEEAEHAMWRAAGLSVSHRGDDIGWPRVAAAFTFRSPLHFEDEFEVIVRVARIRTRALDYEHTIHRGGTIIGSGTMTTVCVRHTPQGMQPADIPQEVRERLAAILPAPAGSPRPRET
jgi:YbgC/YbaW family acyl-CoA thioester hydrolase